ncbi:hypothetical protein ACEQPO_25260 [Bacillus sp. SL00103]
MKRAYKVPICACDADSDQYRDGMTPVIKRPNTSGKKAVQP